MALSGPQFLPSTEDAPRGWVVKSTSTVYKTAMIARYTSAAGADEGYADNVGASANMSILGVSEQNGGALPAGHTLTMSAEVRALEMVIPLVFSGGLTTAKRNALVYGVDENTGSLTPGAGIPVGMLMEVISATRAKVGVGPEFVARANAAAAALLLAANAFQVDEYTNPAAASTTALHAATATSIAVQTLLTAALSAGGIAALLAYPRNVTFTTGGTATDAPASVVITGTDIDDNALTETLVLSQSAGTDAGVKAFKTITSIVYGAGIGAGGTVAVGTGVKMGFSKSIRSRAGRLAVIQQVAVGSVVTTGTFVDATTSPPHGTYAPATAQDAANDYSVTYEHT